MKKLYLSICLSILSLTLIAQMKMPADSKRDFDRLMELSKYPEMLNESDWAALPIYHFDGRVFVSVIGKIHTSAQWNFVQQNDVLLGSKTGRIVTMKVPLDRFSDANFEEIYEYMEIPGKAQPHLNLVRKDVRADSVQLGLGLPQSFTGKDVIIGVTDWGFDYTHPMFYDTLYQHTRILAAWDQYKNSGMHPDGFAYGSEFDTEDELLEAQSDTSNIYSYAYHGSHVAGIAGGSGGTTTNYRGIAPEAQFLFTTFLVDYASVIDAFHWMKSRAEQEGKPLVINMSWGLYYIGTLDGNSLISQAIDQLSDEGVLFVASAGNNGDNDFHIKKEFNGDLLTSRIMFDSYANPTMWGESITMWGEVGEEFSAGFKVYNSGNTLLGETPLYESANAQPYLDSMIVTANNDTVWFNLTVDAAHPLNGRPHMRLRVKNTNGSLRIVLNATAESGTVHFWNLVELTNGVGNWGLPFVTFGGSTGMSGDSEYSISEPTCTASVISVAAYASEYMNVFGNPAGGQRAGFSSIGPLITGAMKPDIAAPGVSVASSMSSFTDATFASIQTVTFNEREYDFARLSGTSMASPCVAGIAALMLDANPYLTPAQVKDIIQASARVDQHTGNIISPPGDLMWGFGKVNAYAAVQMALSTEGLSVEYQNKSAIRVFPNPVSDLLQVKIPSDQKVISVIVTDMAGKQISLHLMYGQISVSHLSSGIYSLELVTDRETVRTKLMISRP